MRHKSIQRLLLAACASALGVSALRGAPVEPVIQPTAYPVLQPGTMVPLPLTVEGGHVDVWSVGNEQRLLVNGGATIQLGYRTLHATTAAVFLTPTNDGGENAYDVAIYLSGSARVEEGPRRSSTVSVANDLLVTSRIPRDVNLVGTPVSRVEEKNPIVQAGLALRQKLTDQPMAIVYVPNVTIQSTEVALQRGWIAKGDDNRIIAGPGEIAIANSPGGKLGPGGPNFKPPAPPRPTVLATAEEVEPVRHSDGELVTLMRGSFYLLRSTPDGKPPLELRAQRAVLFSPEQGTGATTQPATGEGRIAKAVTGVYLEGNVTVQMGQQTIRAERVYYDFTSDRAIMLDATLSSVDEKRNVPVYLRAREIRQLARTQYTAKSASFSTSEFAEPHYQIGASSIYLQNVTPEDSDGKTVGPTVYAFKSEDTTVDVRGVPIFYWPFLSGRTDEGNIPLTRLKIGDSRTYGLSLETGWDIFALANVEHPEGVRARLDLDYFSKRGPGGGLQATQTSDDSSSELDSYIMEDTGTDRLGRDRTDITVADELRGRVLARHTQDLDSNWTLQLQGSYISDVNYLEEFFPGEYNTGSENESSLYLKYEHGTEAFSLLGKTYLYDFIANADLVDDQFTTEKKPEAKYWRTGDSVLGFLTYYSESGISNNSLMISDATPAQSGLQGLYTGVVANPLLAGIPANESFRQYYQSLGYTTNDVLRGDTRQELDMPLQVGDVKITPYVTGRVTAWDTTFPDTASGDSTTRLWGQVGLRSSMEFWKTYDDVESQFWDVHRVRHIIEPEVTLFETGSTQDRANLEPFDSDVEGISDASGGQFLLHQRWQTKRGGKGHERTVDWIEFNISADMFWHKDQPGLFSPYNILQGMVFASRPELSLVADSINSDLTWRVGERVRYLMDASYSTDTSSLTTISSGLAIDALPQLSYFVGNRYIGPLATDEWTFAADYQLTRKYSFAMAESYDFYFNHNILTQFTLARKLPRFNVAVTATYDANENDTSVVFSAYPEGFPELGLGTGSLRSSASQ